jgi:hypothetical protein
MDIVVPARSERRAYVAGRRPRAHGESSHCRRKAVFRADGDVPMMFYFK